MAVIEIPIANGYYQSRSLPFSSQRCVGWYPVFPEQEALSSSALFSTPGTKLIAQTPLTTEINRGMHVVNGIAYAINGTTLYRINRTFDVQNNQTFDLTALGTIPGSGFVSMADNGDQLCIVVPNNSGYVYTASSGLLEKITDLGFTASGKSESVVFIDGFFVHTSGKTIFHSTINDAKNYNSLDSGLAQADPDDIVSSLNYKNQLFIFGRESIEVFSNIGRFPFSFQRIPGFFVPIGCFARFTPIVFNQGIAFLGGSNKEKAGVFFGSGQGYRRISTIPIEQKIQRATEEEIKNAFTWTYSEDGAIFLGLVVGDDCFVFDANASRLSGRLIWHERKSTRKELGNTQVRWRVNGMVEAYGKILVGDNFNGNIGELSLDTTDEYGSYINREVSMRPLNAQGESLFIDQVELTMESGVTTDSDNAINLSWSDDAKTFVDPLPADIGGLGSYTLRQYWRMLGHSPRYRVFKLNYTGKDKSTLYKMEVTLDASS